MRLSDVAQGRDNNFNLIRFLAAFAVLCSHSFALATGVADAQPLRTQYGLTFGDIAVDVFFVTSGFLVTASLLNRKDAAMFLWARALRVFPALWVMLALTFLMGSALTTDHAYFASHDTWRYLVKNAILLRGIDDSLPGVFASNPWKGAVNGSLWSLKPELQMYMLLLVLWVVTRAKFKWSVLAVTAVSGGWYLVHGIFSDPTNEFPRLAFMFFVGGGFYLLKDRVILNEWVFLALLAVVLLSAINRTAFFWGLSLCLPYLLIYSAYRFNGPIRRFNRGGDYSYGIYIYAFPAQQTLAHLIPGISVAGLMFLSAIMTFALALLSWHLIEKRALTLKVHPTSIKSRDKVVVASAS